MSNSAPNKAVTLAVAAGLLGGATLTRGLLNAELGSVSPFMLYVASVLIASCARGAACGFIVMVGGGLAGYYLFLEPQQDWDKDPAALVALLIYLLVSVLVLLTAYLLRAQTTGVFGQMSRRLEEDM